MKETLMDKTENTKLIKITCNDESVLIQLRLVGTRSEVQVDYLDYHGVRYNKWREHGSFMKLLGKCLGRKFEGTRKAYIEDLYYNNN